MPLQNRVDPYGQIHAVSARGLFTGNRGSIHDPETKALLKRRWTTKAWIICDCAFKGRKRAVFGRNTRGGGPGWTNLFFLDEVTALAAGHRPCFECRREKAKEFADCFGKAFGIAKPKVADMDERLHAERLAVPGNLAHPLDRRDLDELPDGAMIAVDGKAYAVRGGRTIKRVAVSRPHPTPDLRSDPPRRGEGGAPSSPTSSPSTGEVARRAGGGGTEPGQSRCALAWDFGGYTNGSAIFKLGSALLITPQTTVAVLKAGYQPVWDDIT